MSGGSKVVGLWSEAGGNQVPAVEEGLVEAVAAPAETLDEPPEWDGPEWDGDALSAPVWQWRRPLAIGACVAAAIGWVALAGYAAWQRLGSRLPTPSELMDIIFTASAPLALIGVVYLLLARNSRREAQRFAATAASLRGEGMRLEQMFAYVAARMDDQRIALSEQREQLMTLGEDAATRMAGVSDAMRGEVESIGRHANALKTSAAAARADMAVLLADLPKAQVQTRQMVTALQEAGLAAHEKAGALDAQLAMLALRGREADEIAGSAAQKLAAHLARVEGVSETAGTRLEAAAGTMTKAVDAALAKAAEAIDAARKGMEAQGSAMLALVEQSQAAMAQAGSESAASISERIETVGARIDGFAITLAEQDQATRALVEQIGEGLNLIEARFGDLDRAGREKTERLTQSIGDLRGHAEAMTAALESGSGAAAALIDRAETLMTALDASVREIDETLPEALLRLDARAETTRKAVGNAAPEVSALETAAQAALDRLNEAEAVLTRQRAAIGSFAEDTEARLTKGREAVEALSASIGEADASARQLAEGATPQLVDALVRTRETAVQAAERARQAISDVIPASVAALSEASGHAMSEAISGRVEAQMADIATAAERAVEAAHKASERLMRQMLTIGETTSVLEARVAEARADLEASDRDNFSRRVALLIESLNSTAIDVTKILSNEVTDAAWAAYLRGDRGVFTRRAVKLLDVGEAREILRHYETDPEFREQVNRYIHDFEAMLRNILSTRDGSKLGVTLLSSDMGKLYVALAQAIERLRT